MSLEKKRSYFKKKRFIIPLAFLILIFAFRLYLPFFLKNHLNKTLNNISGYYGEVVDVDVFIFRGAYTIKGLHLNKNTTKSQKPLLSIPKTDISIEWKTLFKTKLVSDVVLTNPEVAFSLKENETNGINVNDWPKIFKELIMIDINRLEVKQGKLTFLEDYEQPNIFFEINDIALYTDNLSNVVEKKRLLNSPIRASGFTPSNAKVFLEGYMNFSKKIPDMDLFFTVGNTETSNLNNFTNHYTGLEFKQGNFSVKSEITVINENIKGYVKPIFSNTQLTGNAENFTVEIWDGYSEFFNFILKNQNLETFEQKVFFEGSLKNENSDAWSSFEDIFKNAWLKTFSKSNHEIKDKPMKLTPQQKRELRKKARDEERARRKKEREIKNG